MPHTLYKTQGTCSQFIDVTVDDEGVIQQVFFYGGCDGNLQGICRLVNGIRCGGKPTSCPDQLCRALESLKQSAQEK